jgi:predicted membrane-bound dolichyl-phosphate-mannose-protein mannosyltransferase
MSSPAMSSTRARVVLILLLLVAFSLRVAPLTAHRFHPDEALYASWALKTQADPALLSAPVDKPPLLLYLLAGMYRVLGPSEAAFRLPNVFASVLSVALLNSIGKRVYGRSTGLLAAAVFAASPFAIQFASTVFTDPLLMLWFLLATLAALEGRPVWAGVASGLAYATKQQAMLLVPLVMLACAMRAAHTPEGTEDPVAVPHFVDWRRSARALVSILIGFLPVLGLVVWWDSLRWHVQPSYWQRGLTSYGGMSLAAVSSWASRRASWWPLLGSVLASRFLNGLLLLALPAALWPFMRGLQRRQHGVHVPWQARWDILFALFTVVYLIAHVVVEVQIWDRYLLPIVPILCLLLGRLLNRLLRALGRILARRAGVLAHSGAANGRPALGLAMASVALLSSLAGPAWLGATGQLPVGGAHGAYDGVEVLADAARALLPAEATLYYHDLGWHYGYYLRDARFALVWYSDADALVELVCSGSERGSAIAFPAWEDDDPVRQTLERGGLALVPQFIVRDSAGLPSFELHLIERAGTGSCRGAAT